MSRGREGSGEPVVRLLLWYAYHFPFTSGFAVNNDFRATAVVRPGTLVTIPIVAVEAPGVVPAVVVVARIFLVTD